MRKSTAWRQQAPEWLAAEKIELPPPSVLVVRFARLERALFDRGASTTSSPQ